MAPNLPKNPDLPLSYQKPGVYTYLSYQGSGTAPSNRRVLLLGYKTRQGIAPLNVPVQVNNEGDTNLASGVGSELSRMYRAFTSHLQGGAGAEVWLCPVEPQSSGSAQTCVLQIVASPSGTNPGTNKTAEASGVLSLFVCGYRSDAGVARGDDFATIAGNVVTQLQTIEDFLPCTVSQGTGTDNDTVILTMRHKGQSGQDLPVMVSVSNPFLGISVSPGSITLSGNTGKPARVHTLLVTTQMVAHILGDAEAPATTAPALATSINAAHAFPVTASASGSTVLLYLEENRVFNRPSVATTDPGQKIQLSAGNQGSGAPNLSNALQSISAQPAFSLWVTPLIDAASLGTLSTHIELEASGRIQKGQVLLICDTQRLTKTGAIPVSTTPMLTASPRTFLGWCGASPQQGYELAARMAAAVISQNYPPHNYAGEVLKTSGQVPLLLPHEAVRPTDSDINAALVSYFLTPLQANGEGQLTIVSGRTSAKPGAKMDLKFVFWGTVLSADYCRDDIGVYLTATLSQKNTKISGTPNTSNTVTVDGILSLLYARMLLWESLDILDGAEALKTILEAQINVAYPARADIRLPLRFPVPLEQLSLFADQVS